MSRALGAIAAVTLAVTLAAAATAAAGRGDVRASTRIAVDAMTDNSVDAILIGSIDSRRPKCLDNRRVRVTVVPQSGPNLAFDVARTGGGGGWFAIGPLDEVEAIGPIDAIELAVAKRKLPLAGDRELICAGVRKRVGLS
ncbi:MAG: hypothetical protein R2691_12980 [Solirubrobacterales bacterium]